MVYTVRAVPVLTVPVPSEFWFHRFRFETVPTALTVLVPAFLMFLMVPAVPVPTVPVPMVPVPGGSVSRRFQFRTVPVPDGSLGRKRFRRFRFLRFRFPVHGSIHGLTVMVNRN